VLRLRSLHRANGGYYLMTTLAGGADPSGLVEPDGRWTGSLAEDLAIREKTVDRPGLAAAFKGLHPADRHPLDPDHRRVSVAAFDCVFAAPKSVSVLHALGSDEVSAVVRAAHVGAVEGVLGHLEREAAFVRRQGSLVDARGLLAAAFLHRTSRAPDPHLHTHLLVVNLGLDEKGRWSAIDARPIYASVGIAGSLYRAALRRAISDRLDLSWESRAEGFADLIGMPKSALRGFSRRSDEIEAELREALQRSPRSKEIAARRTRRAKQLDMRYEDLVGEWRERAFELGIARSTLSRLSTPSREGPITARERSAEVARAVEAATASFDRPFTRGELLRATSGRLVDGAPVTEIERAIDDELQGPLVVRTEERVAHLRARSGRFPSGITEARFLSSEAAALVRERDEGLDALGRSVPQLSAKTARFERGGFVLPPSSTVYEFVRAAAIFAEGEGRHVVAFTSSRVGAAQLEALTGIAPEPWRRAATLAEGTLVVVDDPAATPIRATAELVESSRSGRVAAVFLDRRTKRNPPSGGLAIAGAVGPLERFEVDGVRVVFAPNLARLADETRRLAGFARAAGREPCIVSARSDAIAGLFGRTTDPARLGPVLARDPLTEVITVGAASVLGRMIAEVPDESRTHLVVAPIGADRPGRVAALSIAEPADLRRSLGRFPVGSPERVKWLARCEARDRARTLDGRRLLDRARDDWSSRRRELGRSL
jgi:conjugative relaxase-like TrwC/TraI family protein